MKKSEIVALATIEHFTIDCGKKNTVISNAMFENRFLKGKNIINQATNSLADMGLIFKFKDGYNQEFRYCINLQ